MRLAFHFVYGSTTVTLSPVGSRCDHRVRGGRADLGLIIGPGLFNESNSIGALIGPPWNILLHTPRHLDRRAERRRRPRAAGPPMGHVGVRGRTGRAGGDSVGGRPASSFPCAAHTDDAQSRGSRPDQGIATTSDHKDRLHPHALMNQSSSMQDRDPTGARLIRWLAEQAPTARTWAPTLYDELTFALGDEIGGRRSCV